MTFLGFQPRRITWNCFSLCLPGVGDYAQLKKDDDKISAADTPVETKKPKRTLTDWRTIPIVKKYNLIKQIGKGGFSAIWLAENRLSRERVALKVVDLTDPDLEPDEVATLLIEAKFLRTLDCPYLVRCFDTAANEEWLVLVLEYLSGGEILDRIHKVTKYTEAEAGKLFAQVVSAISYMHNLNLIHRDIKPENIMFAQPVEQCQAEGRPLRVKLIDLGMAMLYDPKKEHRGCIGTPGFVAPELWNDGPHTPACDVYSLGVVLFIMLTGRKPHSGIDIRMMTYCNKSIKDAPGLKDERFQALSADARQLLLSMLSDDPADRPSCLAVLQHPFITAVDSNMDAHREMGDTVRRRMRELAQLRRMHGLRYALRVQKPLGGDHHTLLQLLDQRRLKMKREHPPVFARTTDAEPPSFGRKSEPPQHKPSSAWLADSATDSVRRASGPGIITENAPSAIGSAGSAAAPPAAAAEIRAPPFARCSLAQSYALQPGVYTAPSRKSITRSPSTGNVSGRGGGAGGAGNGSGSSAAISRLAASACAAATAASSSASSSAFFAKDGATPAAGATAPPPRPSAAAGQLPGDSKTFVLPFARSSGSSFVANTPPSCHAVKPPPPLTPQSQQLSPHHQHQHQQLPPVGVSTTFTTGPPTAVPRPVLTLANAAAASCSSLSVSAGGAGPLTPTSPDQSSRDMGVPVPNDLAARPRCGGGGGGAAPLGIGLDLDPGPNDLAGGMPHPHPHGYPHGHLPPLNMDPMVLMNVLPSLQRCSSMNAVVGLGLEGDDARLGGGSPVAPPAVLEQALLTRCLSANPLTLELLGHQASLQRVLTQADSELGREDRRLVAAATAGEAQLGAETSQEGSEGRREERQEPQPQRT